MFKLINRFLDWLLLDDETKELMKINEIATLQFEAVRTSNIEALEIAKEIWKDLEFEYHKEKVEYWTEHCDFSLKLLKQIENDKIHDGGVQTITK